LYCISEIFDGAEPKKGKGCIQQAWSVAALIKLYADYELFALEGDGNIKMKFGSEKAY
jgi:hypothetical protein